MKYIHVFWILWLLSNCGAPPENGQKPHLTTENDLSAGSNDGETDTTVVVIGDSEENPPICGVYLELRFKDNVIYYRNLSANYLYVEIIDDKTATTISWNILYPAGWPGDWDKDVEEPEFEFSHGEEVTINVFYITFDAENWDLNEICDSKSFILP